MYKIFYHSIKLFGKIAMMAILCLSFNSFSDTRVIYRENEKSKSMILLETELTQDIVLDKLQLILEHIRFRQKNESGLYPPLPKELGVDFDTTSIESTIIAKIVTEAICILRDNAKREQALALLEPLILDAIDGNVDNISIAEGIELYFLSEFAENDVYRKDSTRIDSIIQTLTKAYHHQNTNVREVAESYLRRLSFIFTRDKGRCERVIETLADGDEKIAESLRFRIYSMSGYASYVVSPEEYDIVRSKTTQELLEYYLRNKMDAKIRSLLIHRLESESPENELIKEAILNERLDVYCKLGLLSHAILEKGSSEKERAKIDSEIVAIENNINSTPVGSKIQMGTVDIVNNLRRLVILPDSITQPIKQEWEQKRWEEIKGRSNPEEVDEILASWEPLTFHAYGTEKVVKILKKIFDRPLTAENEVHNIRKALGVMCDIMEQDIQYKDSFCDFIIIFADNLIEQNPQWKNERWFMENTMPDSITSDVRTLLFHDLRRAININCTKTKKQGSTGGRKPITQQVTNQ